MTMTASQVQASAEKIGATIKADGALNLLFKTEIDHREALKVSVIHCMWAITAEFGDKLADMPEPDSGPEGNNPDLYEESTGKKGTRTGSYWGDSALYAPTVKAWVAYKKLLIRVKANPNEPDFAEYTKRGEAWIKAELAMTTQRITAAQNLMRNGARLLFKMAQIRDEYPSVTVQLDGAKDKDGVWQLARTTKPLCIIANPEEGSDVPAVVIARLSVGEFLGIDVKRAQDNGGTPLALLASRKRESSPADLTANIKSPGKADEYVSSLVHFLDDDNDTDRFINYLCKEGHETAVEAARDLYLYLDKILNGNKRVNAIVQKIATEGLPEKKVA